MSHPFREAVESGDVDRIVGLLAPDVIMRSPASFQPIVGAEAAGRLLRAVAAAFQDFRYIDEMADGDRSMLRFLTRVGDRDVEGVDLVRMRDGRVAELTVMVRPMSGLVALMTAVAGRLAEA